MNTGGDIVAGDKATTTVIQEGFAGEEQKHQFRAQLDILCDALQALKTEIEAHPKLTADQKEKAESEILGNMNVLKGVKAETATVRVSEKPPTDVISTVDTALRRTGGVMDKLQGLAKTTVDVAEEIGAFSVKYGPLILSARRLFGLP
jgi:hypothetical protein